MPPYATASALSLRPARRARPTVPPRPPATFALHDEGDGLCALYLSPITPGEILEALSSLKLGGELVDITPRWGCAGSSVVAADLQPALRGPVEVLHRPPSAALPALPTLLADPHGALPEGSGRRFALAAPDPGHVVLYSREARVLAAALGAFLQGRLLQADPRGLLPPVDLELVTPLLAPLPPGAWREVGVRCHGRYWCVELPARSTSDAGEPVVLEDLRWVGGPGRGWRPGWRW